MLELLPRKIEGEVLTKKEDEVIDNIIREIFGPDVSLDYIDKDAVSKTIHENDCTKIKGFSYFAVIGYYD